jgi:hypothetical protein
MWPTHTTSDADAQKKRKRPGGPDPGPSFRSGGAPTAEQVGRSHSPRYGRSTARNPSKMRNSTWLSTPGGPTGPTGPEWSETAGPVLSRTDRATELDPYLDPWLLEGPEGLVGTFATLTGGRAWGSVVVMNMAFISGSGVSPGQVHVLCGAGIGGGGFLPQPEPSGTGRTRPNGREVAAHPATLTGTPSRALSRDGSRIQARHLIASLLGTQDRGSTGRHALRLSGNRQSGARP